MNTLGRELQPNVHFMILELGVLSGQQVVPVLLLTGIESLHLVTVSPTEVSRDEEEVPGQISWWQDVTGFSHLPNWRKSWSQDCRSGPEITLSSSIKMKNPKLSEGSFSSS